MKKCLLIVGMPRSGTKLFRNLCNQHSLLNITEFETHFFPFLINKFGYNLENSELTPESLLKYIESTTFYYNIQNMGRQLRLEDLKKIKIKDWNSILTFILTFFAPEDKKDYLYFGDKTPNYIYHLPLLKKVLPDAKVVVLIRDPRDYALSIKKTWKKSLYRAAINWRCGMLKMMNDISSFSKDVYFVKYEDLITNSQNTMKDFCSFLNIPFEEKMMTLKKPTEYVGSTKGKKYIVGSNYNKYKLDLSKRKIKRIEELSFEMLSNWYTPEYATSEVKMSKFSFQFLKLRDGLNAWRHHIKEKTFFKGTWYFYKLHRVKGNQEIYF